MKMVRIAALAGACCLTGAFAAGCGPSDGTGGTGGAGSGGKSASGGAPGSGGSSSGGSSSGGAAPSTGGAPGSGGAPSSGGMQGSGGAAPRTGGAPGSGGAASGGSGGNSSGGAGGTGGAVGSGGAGTGGRGTGGSGPVTPHGSAAKFICPQGATYGNPLQGMGSVQQIAAPSGDYFAFIEGPLWIGGNINTVFFSDNASQPERIWKVVPPSTTAMQFMGMSGSNGLAVDNNDKIIVADQRNRRITRVDPSNGMMLGVVATTSAKPNDVLVRSDDNIYFTDPDTGFYRISPTGTVSAAMNVMQGSRPNGIELSLDENTLYVGDVGNKTITKFTVAADGTVMTGTAAPFATTMNTTTDGMCVDCAGNVYASTQNGVEVYSPSGMYIGTVPTGEASNCTFGGADRKTLYVTSRAVLKYVTLAVPGLPN